MTDYPNFVRFITFMLSAPSSDFRHITNLLQILIIKAFKRRRNVCKDRNLYLHAAKLQPLNVCSDPLLEAQKNLALLFFFHRKIFFNLIHHISFLEPNWLWICYVRYKCVSVTFSRFSFVKEKFYLSYLPLSLTLKALTRWGWFLLIG